MILPFRPKPKANESLTSWLGRVADANCTSVPSILSSYVGEKRWDRMDLDLLGESEIDVLSEITGIQDRSQLFNMTLTQWGEVILQSNKADRKSWISSTFTMRYCPLCLLKDKIPYLRLAWRLHFLPICVDHKIILQTGCWKKECGYSQPINKYNQTGTCAACGTLFRNAPIIKVKECKHLLQFASSSIRILQTRQFPYKTKFPYGVKDFFEVLLFLVRYYAQYLLRDASWEDLLTAYSLPASPPYEWRNNNSIACILLERSLQVIDNWSASVDEIVAKNRTHLKRLCYDNGINVPAVLRLRMDKDVQIINKPDADCVYPQHHIVGTSLEERIDQTIQYLVRNNHCPHVKTVCRTAGISYKKIKRMTGLSDYINAEKRRFEQKQEDDIRMAVASLHSRGIRVTITSVSAYLGRSHPYLRKTRLATFSSAVQQLTKSNEAISPDSMGTKSSK